MAMAVVTDTAGADVEAAAGQQATEEVVEEGLGASVRERAHLVAVAWGLRVGSQAVALAESM